MTSEIFSRQTVTTSLPGGIAHIWHTGKFWVASDYANGHIKTRIDDNYYAHWADPFVFADQKALDHFMADTSPELLQMRTYIGLVRPLRAGFVNLLGELTEQFGNLLGSFKPNFSAQNPVEQFLTGEANLRAEAHHGVSVFDWNPIIEGRWCLQGVVTDPNQFFHLARMAAIEHQMADAYSGTPGHGLEFHRIPVTAPTGDFPRIQTPWDRTSRTLVLAMTPGVEPRLTPSDQWTLPWELNTASLPDRFRNESFVLAACVPSFKAPECVCDRTYSLVQRKAPLDVLAA